MKMEFKLLPKEHMLGRDLKSETFDVDYSHDTAFPMKYVPAFDGNIDFYNMQEMEMDLEM